MTRLLAFLLLAALVAGCVDDGAGPAAPPSFQRDARFGSGLNYTATDANGLPVPFPLCLEGCDFNMTPDEGRQGNEVTIAVNPKDPRNVVGGAKDYYPPDAGDCVWDGVYVTHDGGRTYQDRSFDGSPWRAINDPDNFTPNYASTFWCTTDPVAYFDVNGNLYYLLMAYQADPVTGSKAGEDEIPSHPLGEGALNDWAFNRATQIVAVSDDGGDTFHTFTPILEGSYPIAFHDKGWIAASADGTVHVMWWASAAPGNVYFRSTDGGQTYGDPEVLALVGQNAGQGSFLDVGTGAEVYALWTTGGEVQMRRSSDTGATWDEARAILSVNDAQHPGLSPRDRVTGFPAMATDRNPASPFADAVYVVWHDACLDAWRDGCASDVGSGVFVAASFDKGTTWSDPVRVSDPSEHWRMLPAISVSPGGVLDVSWMESTDTMVPAAGEVPEHARLAQMYSYSLDGGATWSVPVDVRDADDGGWDPALSHHQNGMIFLGDYNDIDSSWRAAHPVWPDTRDGEAVKVYTATMERPWFAEGWTAGSRATAEQDIAKLPLA